MTIERTAVENLRHIAVQKHIDWLVTFAIKRRQQIYEQTQHHRTNSKLYPRIAQLAEHLFHQAHCAGEIERHKATEQS